MKVLPVRSHVSRPHYFHTHEEMCGGGSQPSNERYVGCQMDTAAEEGVSEIARNGQGSRIVCGVWWCKIINYYVLSRLHPLNHGMTPHPPSRVRKRDRTKEFICDATCMSHNGWQGNDCNLPFLPMREFCIHSRIRPRSLVGRTTDVFE